MAADEPLRSGPAPAAGYVYLSASRGMPGFVQLCSSEDDPRGRRWSLQTMSGVTHFRCVYAVPSGDAPALAARFREVLLEDEVPRHEEFFRMPERFARQILEAEARRFPGGPVPPAPRWRRPVLSALMLAAVMFSTLGFTPRPAQPAVTPTPAPAPATPLPMPKFRL